VEKFDTIEAIKLVGEGATKRTIYYYRDIYVNDVIKIGVNYFYTQAFIDKVKKNRAGNRIKSQEPRTKDELLKVISKLENDIKELQEQLQEYENSEVYERASEGMRVEVFTQDEYLLFSERLTQWRIQRKELELQEKEIKSLEEQKQFDRSQLDYFKKANDKILEQHQKLIELIGQRNKIEAVEKEVIPKQPYDI
jgi:hypothetical protein